MLDLARQTADDNKAEQYEATALAMLDTLCTPAYLGERAGADDVPPAAAPGPQVACTDSKILPAADAVVGVRDGSHFDVDVWPDLKPRVNALLRIVSMVFVLLFALVAPIGTIATWKGASASGNMMPRAS